MQGATKLLTKPFSNHFLPLLRHPQKAGRGLLMAQLEKSSNVSSGKCLQLPALRCLLWKMIGWSSPGTSSIAPGSWISYYHCITKHSKVKSVKQQSSCFAHRFCGSGIQAELDWAIRTGGHSRGCSQRLAEAADYLKVQMNETARWFIHMAGSWH